MSTVKINQKDYEIPELTFRHLPMMEKSGLSPFDLASGKYIFTSAQAFTAIVVGCDLDVADYLLEQHILGGGTIQPIFEAFMNAMYESHFFKKLLERTEKAKKTAPEAPAESNQEHLAN